MRNALLALLALSFFLVRCSKGDDPAPGNGSSGSPQLESSFANGDLMPAKYGKDHGNVSPPLTIKNVPDGTVEMVVTMRDIDHNDSWHWAVWNIPKNKTSISEGETWSGTSTTVGSNDYGTGYVGPFPPSEHQYEITVYFLSQKINLMKTAYSSLPTVISDHIIDQVSIIGRYK